jgi:hypothetical protein
MKGISSRSGDKVRKSKPSSCCVMVCSGLEHSRGAITGKAAVENIYNLSNYPIKPQGLNNHGDTATNSWLLELLTLTGGTYLPTELTADIYKGVFIATLRLASAIVSSM